MWDVEVAAKAQDESAFMKLKESLSEGGRRASYECPRHRVMRIERAERGEAPMLWSDNFFMRTRVLTLRLSFSNNVRTRCPRAVFA